MHHPGATAPLTDLQPLDLSALLYLNPKLLAEPLQCHQPIAEIAQIFIEGLLYLLCSLSGKPDLHTDGSRSSGAVHQMSKTMIASLSFHYLPAALTHLILISLD